MPINYEAAKTLIRGLVQKMKSFRGNWNQNDPTADDYIKNRPFYTEQVEIVILPEITLDGEGNVNIKSPLVVGQEYKITWNGVVYRSIARNYDGYRMIGNKAVYGYDDGIENNTGEPFAAEANGNNLELYFYMDDTVTEPPTVSITTIGESVHKIDSKYINIPANLATIDDVESVAADVESVAADVQSVANNINNKMNATNPVGTGSFSMNRKAGTTIGSHSHAEGYNTTASGVYSHAEGYSTTAVSEYQHVQGKYNQVDGDKKYAHIVGNGTSDSVRSNAHTLDWNGNAWYKGRIKIGGTGGGDATDEVAYKSDLGNITKNILDGSMTGSIRSVSSANEDGSYTIGLDATAFGVGAKASGQYSFANGYGATASNMYSYAEGCNTTASGRASYAEGYDTEAASDYQHVQGKYNQVDVVGKYAHIVGNGIADEARSNAHTIDWNGVGWFAGGLKVGGTGQNDENAERVVLESVLNDYALKTDLNGYVTNLLDGESLGSLRSINSSASYINGYLIGENAVSLGEATKAFGEASFAEGRGSGAFGFASHAEGENTIAEGDYSHTQGKWNIVDTMNKYAHIIGNGENDNARSNAHTIDWDGNAWYQGSIKVGGTGWDDATDEVALKSDITNLKGAANGIASLDANSKIPTFQLPMEDIISAVIAALPTWTGGSY